MTDCLLYTSIQMIRAGPDRKIGVVCDQRNACCSCYFHTKLSFLVFAVFLLYWPLSYAKSGNPALSIITAVLIEGFDFVDIVGVSVKESRFCNDVSAPSAHPRSAFYFIGRIFLWNENAPPARGSAMVILLFYFFPLFYKLLIQFRKRPADIIGRNDRLECYQNPILF